MPGRPATTARRTSRIRCGSASCSPRRAPTRRRSPRRCCTTASRTPSSRVGEVVERFGVAIGELVEALTEDGRIDILGRAQGRAARPGAEAGERRGGDLRRRQARQPARDAHPLCRARARRRSTSTRRRASTCGCGLAPDSRWSIGWPRGWRCRRPAHRAQRLRRPARRRDRAPSERTSPATAGGERAGAERSSVIVDCAHYRAGERQHAEPLEIETAAEIAARAGEGEFVWLGLQRSHRRGARAGRSGPSASTRWRSRTRATPTSARSSRTTTARSSSSCAPPATSTRRRRSSSARSTSSSPATT